MALNFGSKITKTLDFLLKYLLSVLKIILTFPKSTRILKITIENVHCEILPQVFFYPMFLGPSFSVPPIRDDLKSRNLSQFTFVLGEGDVRLLLVGKHKRVSSILFLKTMVDNTGENMGVRIQKTKYTIHMDTIAITVDRLLHHRPSH